MIRSARGACPTPLAPRTWFAECREPLSEAAGEQAGSHAVKRLITGREKRGVWRQQRLFTARAAKFSIAGCVGWVWSTTKRGRCCCAVELSVFAGNKLAAV